MSKISRGAKGEKKVKDILHNKIKEYHKILNDLTLVNDKSEMTHQIDHILIHPHGVFVIETKNYYGKIISETHDSFWLKESDILPPLIEVGASCSMTLMSQA